MVKHDLGKLMSFGSGRSESEFEHSSDPLSLIISPFSCQYYKFQFKFSVLLRLRVEYLSDSQTLFIVDGLD